MVTRNKFTIDKLFLYTPLDIDKATSFLSHVRSPLEIDELSLYGATQVNLRFKTTGKIAELKVARNIEPALLHEKISAQLGGIMPQSSIRTSTRDAAAVRNMRSLIAFFSDYQQPLYITAQVHNRTYGFIEDVFVLGTNPSASSSPQHTFDCANIWRTELPELFRSQYETKIPIRR